MNQLIPSPDPSFPASHPGIRPMALRPRPRLFRRLALALLPLLALGGGHALAQLAPEPGTARVEKPLVRAERSMVATANTLASAAGQAMLDRGGSAVDAAIAAQLVLGLVEPQSSGIGGGGFLMVATPDGKLRSYDGRETAPASTTPDRFIGADGAPMRLLPAMDKGRAVGVPGVMAMLAKAHATHGKLPWAELFGPAITLAEDGWEAQPRMVDILTRWRSALEIREDLKALFYVDGPPTVGQRLTNPDYARTLRTLAREGVDTFYRGTLADSMLARLAAAAGPDGPPTLTRTDLETYRPVERDPVCQPYRVYIVCGMGPPSSGGIAILQILGMLERFPLPEMDQTTGLHLLLEAERRAYADRAVHIGDPEGVQVPVAGLLDPTYLAGRSAGIKLDRAATGPVPAGRPPGTSRLGGKAADGRDTSHLSIMDADGMMVSFTTSVEFAFGSGIVVDGYVLNNQLTDFAFEPFANGAPVANAPGPGKRPMSSMSPTIVLDRTGRPVLAVGSPGGSAIIGYVAQTLVAVLDWGMDPQAAIAMPRVLNRNGDTMVEAGQAGDAIAAALTALGHTVKRQDLNSGLQAIQVTPDGLLGGADPRRDGAVVGR